MERMNKMRYRFPEIFAFAPGKNPLDRGETLCYSIVSKKNPFGQIGGEKVIHSQLAENYYIKRLQAEKCTI